MNPRCLLVVVGALAAPALAQKTDISIHPASQSLKFTIESSSKLKSERKMTIDGEEMEGRGGFGGGGVTTTAQKLVFEEGPKGAMWRHYKIAEATVTRPGRDGEDQTNTVQSALAGKKVFIAEDDGGVIVREGDAKGEPLPRNVSQGVPAQLAFDALTPKDAIEVGEEYDLSKHIRSSLAVFAHPIQPARDESGGGGRGERGQGGGRGQGGERAQGGGRGGRGGRRARGVRDAALQALANAKLDCDATGKLVEIVDGVAVVAINGKISGDGSLEEIGMARGGGRGGRGGRGGGGGGGTGTGKVAVNVTGSMKINVAEHRLVSLELKGDVDTATESQRETQRGDFETKSSTKGDFWLKVKCEAGAAKEPAKNSDR